MTTAFQRFKALARASVEVWREKYETLKFIEEELVKAEEIMRSLEEKHPEECKRMESKIEEIKEKILYKFKDLGPLQSYDRSSQPSR